MGKQSSQQADRQDGVQELHSRQIKLKQTVQENIDAVLALLALVDIEPVTRTRNLRYNQIIKSALALNGIDLSVTDDEETGAGAESDKNKGEFQTDADKLEKLLLKFGQEFLGGLIRKDFKVSIAAARNLDFERRLHWAACSGAILVYGRNDTAKQKLTPSELSLHDMIKKEWLYDER
ncbi:hypothetical protein HMPREF2753_09130 [Neisseria sp. HMSC071C03]|nr:hypothetical protein HMPREF3054_10090 [Neisseria sp. HMSC071B12]OHR51431.1 hypothetical protein HMPREF2753_09130 [Neisseria sp. HMSC071C03]